MGQLQIVRHSPKFPVRTWAAGDSLTAGYPTAGVASWCDHTPTGPVHCVAVGGYETWQTNVDLFQGGSSKRQLDTAPVGTPERIIVLTGINDLANGNSAFFQTWVDQLTDELVARSIDFRLVTMLPLPEGNSGSWSLDTARLTHNAWLASTYPTKVVNVETGMGNGASPNRLPAAFSYGDNVHLSFAGAVALGALLDPHVLPSLP